MALLKTETPESAQGEMKEVFEFFQKRLSFVPGPMKLLSASPSQFDLQWRSLQYYINHPALSYPVLSTIRYLVAKEYGYIHCTRLNEEMLKRQGLSDEEISMLSTDPMQAPLEDRERRLVAFVLKAIKTPEAVTGDDMEALRDEGWRDSDILDAVVQGTVMVASSIWMKAFKMDEFDERNS
jgi:alkylhydroperoxidase family enzyme